MPPELLPPPMPEELQFWLTAFWDLSSDRQLGMAVGPLPWTSIELWCSLHELSLDERDEARIFFREMDAKFLEYSKPPAPVDEKKPKKASRKLTVNLFDALWGVKKDGPR